MESQRTIWTAIIVLIVGIALIFLRSTAIDIVVMVLGAMFCCRIGSESVFSVQDTHCYRVRRKSTARICVVRIVGCGCSRRSTWNMDAF